MDYLEHRDIHVRLENGAQPSRLAVVSDRLRHLLVCLFDCGAPQLLHVRFLPGLSDERVFLVAAGSPFSSAGDLSKSARGAGSRATRRRARAGLNCASPWFLPFSTGATEPNAALSNKSKDSFKSRTAKSMFTRRWSRILKTCAGTAEATLPRTRLSGIAFPQCRAST